MAFVLSYAHKNFLGKGHIRDNLEPEIMEEVWERANHLIWLDIELFAWAVSSVPRLLRIHYDGT